MNRLSSLLSGWIKIILVDLPYFNSAYSGYSKGFQFFHSVIQPHPKPSRVS